MATLFVDKVDPQSGTSLEIGSSGDTITIPSGATITNNGTQTGFGGTNTPAFQITRNSYQTVSANTSTKVELDNARIDTASGFDATNDRWVVPSGQGGKYSISWQIFGDAGADSELRLLDATLKVNGTNTLSSICDFRNNNGRQVTVGNTAILDLSASDYLELWGAIYDTSGSPQFGGGSSGGERYKTQMNGYKIIE